MARLRSRRLLLWFFVGAGMVSGSCGSDHPLTPVTPPRVSLVPLGTGILHGTLHSFHQPWSPAGTRMVYQSADSQNTTLQVFDAALPDSVPLDVYTGDWSTDILWSPDGSWLLCRRLL